MSDRTTRTIQIALPGGRTSPDSVAQLIDIIVSKGLEPSERIDSIKAVFGSMSETFTMEVTVSAPLMITPRDQTRHEVDERRM